MVTDALSERARTRFTLPYEGRLLLTILLLALYLLGRLTPLPFFDLDLPMFSNQASRVSLLALGLAPLIEGFSLVELFSLMTSPGRRLRQSRAGRARLNRAALVTSLLLCALQALGIARYAELLSGVSGAISGRWTLTILTLTAGTAAIFAIGQALSEYGIGNGFALLSLAELGRWVIVSWKAWKTESYDGSIIPMLGLLLAAGLLVRFVRTAEDAWMPAFPQSVLPAQWGVAIFPLLAILRRFGVHVSLGESRFAEPVAVLISVPILSWLGFHLLSSRPRLEANLTEPEDVLDNLAAALRRRAVLATVLLTLGAAALVVVRRQWPQAIGSSLRFVEIVVIVAIGLDLWDQFRFQRRNGSTALLTRLDNVHFSYQLEERLQEEEIKALARGHHFRSLFFFFGALAKIDVLVPAEQLGHARAILAELETAREIRAF
jgi:hypothetical protein